MSQAPTTLTTDEAAQAIGVSRPTLYKYAREHPRLLRNWRQGKRRLFDADGVKKFLAMSRELTQL
jgi:excisionase family DNA binding protein